MLYFSARTLSAPRPAEGDAGAYGYVARVGKAPLRPSLFRLASREARGARPAGGKCGADEFGLSFVSFVVNWGLCHFEMTKTPNDKTDKNPNRNPARAAGRLRRDAPGKTGRIRDKRVGSDARAGKVRTEKARLDECRAPVDDGAVRDAEVRRKFGRGKTVDAALLQFFKKPSFLERQVRKRGPVSRFAGGRDERENPLCAQFHHPDKVGKPDFRVRRVEPPVVAERRKPHLERPVVFVDVVGEILFERSDAAKPVAVRVENVVGEQARRASVAVFERVDRHELVVDDGGPENRMVVRCRNVFDEFVDKRFDVFRFRRNVVGAPRGIVVNGEEDSGRHGAAESDLFGGFAPDDDFLHVENQAFGERDVFCAARFKVFERGKIVPYLLLGFEVVAARGLDGGRRLFLGEGISLDLRRGVGTFLPGTLAQFPANPGGDADSTESISRPLDGENPGEHFVCYDRAYHLRESYRIPGKISLFFTKFPSGGRTTAVPAASGEFTHSVAETDRNRHLSAFGCSFAA